MIPVDIPAFGEMLVAFSVPFRGCAPPYGEFVILVERSGGDSGSRDERWKSDAIRKDLL